MRIFSILFICVLFTNCIGKSEELNTLIELKNNVWIDSLCNQFSFKDSIISKDLLYRKSLVDNQIGKVIFNDGILLEFEEGNHLSEKYKLSSNLNGTLVFKALNDNINYLTLFKREIIKDPGIQIEKIHLKVTPNFYYSGFWEFTITGDKKMIYRKERNKNKSDTIIFSDSAFKQIETYVEILNFNKYEDKYQFYVSDGADYEFHIETNEYSKNIESTMLPPEGLWNLISFIDYKLQTE